MSKELSQLWRTARSLHLTKEEKLACAKNIGISVREKTSVRQRVHMTEKKLFSLAKAICLSPAEKVRSREWIFSDSRSSFSLFSIFSVKPLTNLIASFLIVSLASGGIASAAESAMPEDVLYPIKIHINERIMASMKRKTEDRVLFTSLQVERRSEELEHLFSSQNEDVALIEQVTSLLEDHSQSLSSEMDDIDDVLAENIQEKTRRIEERVHEKQKKMAELKMKNPALQKKISSIHTLLVDARMSLREPSLLSEDMSQETPSPDHPFIATMMEGSTPLSVAVMNAPTMDDDIAFTTQTRLRALKRMQKKMLPREVMKANGRNPSDVSPSLPVLMLEQSEKEMNAGNVFQANEISKKAMKEMRRMRKEERR